jgi:xanthine dehydrogenase accessory factor
MGTAMELKVQEEAAPRPAFVTDSEQEILRFARDSWLEGYRVALVTLTDVQGGSARSIGSQMCVRNDGHTCSSRYQAYRGNSPEA